MNNKGLVSIIIPIYNVEDYISKCINSCMNQTYKSIEILLIDDGSTDSSGDIADTFKDVDDRIFVFHKSNGGVSSARNYGIKKSKGEYICFVDSDDYLDSTFVEYMVGLSNKTHSDFCFSKNCYTEIGQKQGDDKIDVVSNTKGTSILLSPYVEVGCWNKIYKSQFIKKNNIYFSEELFYGEGLDFICRVSQLSNSIGIGTERHYFYRKNNLDSATSSFNYNKFINGEKSLLKIREDFKKRDKELDTAWQLHYTLFSINAIIAIMMNKSTFDNFKVVLKKWKKNVKKYALGLLFNMHIEFKHKIKILISIFCPTFLVHLRKKKLKKQVKKSV